MKQIDYRRVDITGGFWKERQERNRDVTAYAVMNRFRETGRFRAFDFAWKEGEPGKPHIFWDSDIAKWMEGVSYLLFKDPSCELRGEVEKLIDRIEKYQDENGYFNIYFTVCEPEERFRNRGNHELYCAGHLMEAAVAYYQATGEDRFLRYMCRYADYIEKVFLLDNSAGFATPGHPEIELALYRLYECTGERRYLNLAMHFINLRGNNAKDKAGEVLPWANARYDESHLPIREQTTAEGHAVRACYLFAGVADIAKETEDRELLRACETVFKNITEKRMYITGGVGSSSVGETFTVDYYLPNKRAYSETCAAIALAFFAQRMLAVTHDGVYADIVEKTIYNGILSGISLDGKSFFYENPLEIDPEDREKDVSVEEGYRERFPINRRVEVFECSCCPPNLLRFFASLGGYIYGVDGGTLFIHQYAESRMAEGDIRAAVQTDYPRTGKVTVKVENATRVALRVPGWCQKFTVNAPYHVKDGYAYIENPPKEIDVVFEMTPVLMCAHERVQSCAGKVALMYGPLVYCAESVDNGAGLKDIALSDKLNATVEYDGAFSANVITVDGYRYCRDGALYAPVTEGVSRKIRVKFIPYFAFANREKCEMTVWCRQENAK